MSNRVPIADWIVGTVGAGLVLLGILYGVLAVDAVKADLADTEKQIAAAEADIARLWDSHKLADERQARAQSAIARALDDGVASRSFNLSEAAQQNMGAYLAMLGATTSLDVPDGLPEDVSEAMAQMNEGDLQSVAWFGNAINQLRTRSMTDINALRDRISTLQGTVVDFKARIAKRERISLALNVIGLLLVLLKDIPVWRTGRPTGGST